MSENEANVPRGDLPNEETKPRQPKQSTTNYPTEIVELPSKGFFYPSDNPLSAGEVQIKYMTAKEEDILTSQTLIQKGVVLDKLMESIIVDDINVDDLLLGDKNAIMIMTRILGYGPQYNIDVTCPNCGVKNEEVIDLAKLDVREIDFDSCTQGVNEFEFELPKSGRTITWRLLTHRDEHDIGIELDNLRKFQKSDVSNEVTTRMKYIIVSVDGDRKKGVVRKFVDEELLSQDSYALRKAQQDYLPDIDLRYNFVCDGCSNVEEITVPMGREFFWPSARR